MPPLDFGTVHDAGDLTPTLIVAPDGSVDLGSEARPFEDAATSVVLLAASCYDSDRLGL